MNFIINEKLIKIHRSRSERDSREGDSLFIVTSIYENRTKRSD